MMKRTAVTRLGPDEPAAMTSQPAQIQQAGASNMHTLAQSAQPQQILGATAMLSVGGVGVGVGAGAFRGGPRAPVINYLKAGAVQYAAPKQPPPRLKTSNEPYPQLFEHHAHAHHPLPGRASPTQPAAQFQRLKVEDALSYLDQVKYKFNTQPQVYNDFLDIMKEFKSQTIDTPGVITRVSNLFKGHPELIVGFNTFLPPGYKIEVQSNGQVSVSMPSPGGLAGAPGVLLGVPPPPAPPQPQPHLVQLLPVTHQSVSSAIVHNLSVSATPANTLHHISQAHQQIEAASIHHSSGGAAATPNCPHSTAPPGQPVEFNHAIEYVNKIKSRFSRQPDKYKRFLEILHAYQRGHRDGKEPQHKQQTEQEVYSQVAKLFENQDDLLAEFGQFLPDAKAVTKPAHYHARTPPPQQFLPDAKAVTKPAHYHARKPPPQQPRVEGEPERPPSPPLVAHAALTHLHPQPAPKHPPTTVPPTQHLKRSPSFSSSNQLPTGAPPPKKSRVSGLTGAAVRDVSYAEAAKYATHHDYSFFDRARRALRSQHVYDNFLSFFDRTRRALRSQHVYDNFLRCLLLFTNEIISSSELLMVTGPFLTRHPELQRWLHDFLGPPSPVPSPAGFNNSNFTSSNSLLSFDREREHSRERDRERPLEKAVRYEPLGPLGAQLRHDRPQGDAAMDIDLSTCKRLGTSYCALPRDAAARRCSGRTALCKEVLNDTWVSFPTWSEDSTFVTSRKTQYEEYIYRCEDERFELDVVIETNASTIRVLEGVQKKLTRMSPEDAARYRLDDCLGGHSPTIHQRALRRIYGEKVAVDIIAGLKKNPVVAVPVVLRRLKAKEEEWREAQKGFNKQWREQNEKYYLKSLDHQGINFKQNDLKAMRSKSLFNEVESAYAARRPAPHLIVDYNMHSRQEAIKILRDCTELLIHHARRQTAIQKAEKRRIKQLLRQFLPDLFNHPRQPLSDDENDEEKEEPPSPGSPTDATDDKPANNTAVKQEKPESSESDNNSDKSSRNNKNDKENKPKNNNNTDSKECVNAANVVKRASNDDSKDVKMEGDIEDDYRDHPPNEARFVCTSSWYLFLRLHGTLCQRLAAARRTALALDMDTRATSVATALRLKPNNLPAEVSSPSEYYGALLELVKGVLDGNTEPAAYEDAAREMLGIRAYPAYTLDKLVSHCVRQKLVDGNTVEVSHKSLDGNTVEVSHEPLDGNTIEVSHKCLDGNTEPAAYEDAAREMLGIRAYPAYTLDKLVSHCVRQLQHCVSEPWSVRAAELCAAGGMRGPPAYVRRAAKYLRHEHNAFLVKVYGGDECRVSFELLEGPPPRASPPLDARLSPTQQRTNNGNPRAIVSRTAAWSLYTERYTTPHTNTPTNKPVFLARNARKCGPGYTHNVATTAPGNVTHTHSRRKPPKLHDHTECHLSDDLRLLSFRPLSLYRSGALAAARASHARLHAKRRQRLREWLGG